MDRPSNEFDSSATRADCATTCYEISCANNDNDNLNRLADDDTLATLLHELDRAIDCSAPGTFDCDDLDVLFLSELSDNGVPEVKADRVEAKRTAMSTVNTSYADDNHSNIPGDDDTLATLLRELDREIDVSAPGTFDCDDFDVLLSELNDNGVPEVKIDRIEARCTAMSTVNSFYADDLLQRMRASETSSIDAAYERIARDDGIVSDHRSRRHSSRRRSRRRPCCDCITNYECK